MDRQGSEIPSPARAEVHPVEDLVGFVLDGQIRIPTFQRGWKWDSSRVLLLLDSVYRGYPIGSLLMWKRAVEAAELTIGPVTRMVEAREDGWAVVDGQQRLTALVGTLAHPDHAPDPADPFSVWFDPTDPVAPFKPAPRLGAITDAWVPVPTLLDAAALSEWCFARPRFRDDKPLRQRVFDASKRIREYRVPIYIVDVLEQAVPREIYIRTNRGGAPMEESDVFNALAGGRTGNPTGIDDLAREPELLGMGALKRHKLLQCVMAVAGLNVTHRLNDQKGQDLSPGELEAALAATAPALRGALVFLLKHAQIPHLRLLPYSAPLIVLSRFFAQHPEPAARSRDLLVRWVWRGMLTRAHEHNERTSLRRGVAAIKGDEEGSVQRLLKLVPTEPPRSHWWLDPPFDGRSAASRIGALGLASLRPLTPGSALPVALAATLGGDETRALSKLVRSTEAEGLTLANRVFVASAGDARRLLDPDRDQALLASHALDAETTRLLRQGDLAQGLLRRRERLAAVLRDLGQGLARWGDNDRPSIDYLLSDPDEAA